FAVFDDILQTHRASENMGRLIQSTFQNLSGVQNLTIYDAQGFVASINSPSNTGKKPRYDDETLNRLKNVKTGALLAGNRPIYATRINGRIYIAQLALDIFSKYFELARATSVMVVGDNGSVILGVFNYKNDVANSATLFKLIDALKFRDKQIAVAKEVTLENGLRVFAALSPVPGTDGSTVVVQSPVTQATEMVQQILMESLPTVFVILLLAIVFGIYMTARLVRPIEELTEATSRIAEGSWIVSIKNRTSDEIGRLVDAFSKMGRELQAREESLTKAHEEVRRSERMATLGKFSAGIAHEVKNPLNAIAGFAELIRKDHAAKKDEGLDKYLEIILSESRRATSIVSELLAFARNKPPTLENCRVAETLDAAAEVFSVQARNAGVEIIREYVHPDLMAKLDREMIAQVWSNLLINAAHAMEENAKDRPRKLTLRIEKDGLFARVDFLDT
ncbi:MAG: histidine kinase dimerization/phospho-acceptor domain-containing protein, partial [Bdellovibrionota bacterium]